MIAKSLFSSAALLLSHSAFAQVQSGKVLYEETIKMNVQLEGEAAQFAHLFPKEQKMQHMLHFSPDAALFQPVPQKAQPEEDAAEGPGGRRMRMMINTPQDLIYTGIKDGKSVAQRDFMGRKFLVTGDLKKGQWKMTGNGKTVLSYPCQEAMMLRDKDTITAWFTTAIPVSAGPHGWSGLPGMILAATINSNVTINATAVEPGPVTEAALAQPKGGKKVTDAEYKAIVDAKMKELGATGEGGDQVIIKVRGN
jgi:GLPGLI family protein